MGNGQWWRGGGAVLEIEGRYIRVCGENWEKNKKGKNIFIV